MQPKKYLTILLLFLALIGSASAATYYVAPYGSDAHTKQQAQDATTPWGTISYGTSQLLAGDTLLVREGTY